MAEDEGVLTEKGEFKLENGANIGNVDNILKDLPYKVYSVLIYFPNGTDPAGIELSSPSDPSEEIAMDFKLNSDSKASAGLQIALAHLDSLGREIISVTHSGSGVDCYNVEDHLWRDWMRFFIVTKDKPKSP